MTEEDAQDNVSLIHKCMFTMLSAQQQGQFDVRVSLGILCLIATWLYECPEVVKEFLTEGSNIQFASFFLKKTFFLKKHLS